MWFLPQQNELHVQTHEPSLRFMSEGLISLMEVKFKEEWAVSWMQEDTVGAPSMAPQHSQSSQADGFYCQLCSTGACLPAGGAAQTCQGGNTPECIPYPKAALLPPPLAGTILHRVPVDLGESEFPRAVTHSALTGFPSLSH